MPHLRQGFAEAMPSGEHMVHQRPRSASPQCAAPVQIKSNTALSQGSYRKKQVQLNWFPPN